VFHLFQLESHTPDTLLSEEGVVGPDVDKSVPLPSELEQEIKIQKGSEPLGKFIFFKTYPVLLTVRLTVKLAH
jgi:hypothetical protein